MTRLLTRFTTVEFLVLDLTLLCSFGFFAILLLATLVLAVMGSRRRGFDSSATGIGVASALGFRTTRLLTRFTLAAVLVLARTGRFGFFVVLLLATLALAEMEFRRRVFALL
jgi:hypothetical protein